MQPAAGASLDRRSLRDEILIVLSLTVLYSAALAILDLLAAPIRGVSVATTSQSVSSLEVVRRFVTFGFALAPVWLVVYLLRRSGEGPRAIGLPAREFARSIPFGAYLALVVAIAGLDLYLLSLHYGLSRFVIPVPPIGHWWTLPVLVLDAAENGLLEEVIVVGFLLHRLDQAGWRPARALWASAILRGSYHLYQGYGAFIGNLVMGLFFGLIFQRTRRVWPLIVAHTLIDVAAGVGYLYFRSHLSGF